MQTFANGLQSALDHLTSIKRAFSHTTHRSTWTPLLLFWHPSTAVSRDRTRQKFTNHHFQQHDVEIIYDKQFRPHYS